MSGGVRPKEAKSLGIFGSPAFVVDGEVFWGDDRVDDAIRWSNAGRAAVTPNPAALG
jgi:hypothetical protein